MTKINKTNKMRTTILESRIFFANYFLYNFAKRHALKKELQSHLNQFKSSEIRDINKMDSVSSLNQRINEYMEYKAEVTTTLGKCETKECSNYYMSKLGLIDEMINRCRTKIEFLKRTMGVSDKVMTKAGLSEAFPILPVLAGIEAGAGVKGYMDGSKDGKNLASKILERDMKLDTIRDHYYIIKDLEKRMKKLKYKWEMSCDKNDETCNKEYKREYTFLEKEMQMLRSQYIDSVEKYKQQSLYVNPKKLFSKTK